MDFSPDGKYLASSSQEVRLWDRAARKPIVPFAEPLDTFSFKSILSPQGRWAIFSPDGKRFLTLGDSKFSLYELNSGRWIADADYDSHGLLGRIAFSPDGMKIVANRLSDGHFRLFDAETGKPLGDWRKKLPFAPQNLVFAPNVKTVATGGRDVNDAAYQKAQIWDWRTGQQISEIDCQGPRHSYRFTPDSQLLAVGEKGGALRLCRVADGKVVRILLHPPQRVFTCRFFAKDKLVALTEDGILHPWDRVALKEGQLSKLLLPPQELLAAWSPRGEYLATASRKGDLRLWNADTGKLLWQQHNVLAYLPLPRTRADYHGLREEPALFLSSKGATFSRYGASGSLPVAPIVFSADGRFLASPTKAGVISVWDTVSGRIGYEIKVSLPVKCLALGQKYLACVSLLGNAAIKVFDLSTGQQIKEVRLPPYLKQPNSRPSFGEPNRSVESLHLSADGRWLVGVERRIFHGFERQIKVERQIHLWNTDNEELLGLDPKAITLPGLAGDVVAFSPNGKLLAYYLRWGHPKQTGQLAIWRLGQGELAQTASPRAFEADSLVFSQDSRTLAVCGHTTVLLLDVEKRFQNPKK